MAEKKKGKKKEKATGLTEAQASELNESKRKEISKAGGKTHDNVHERGLNYQRDADATKEQALRENERRRRGDVTGWTPKKKRIERTECGCCCCAFGWPVCLPTWSDLGRYLALIFILLPPTLLICLLCLIPWSIDCLRFTRPVMPVADDDVGRPGHISEEDVEDAEDPEHPYGRYRGFNPDIGHVPMGFLLPWSHSKSESLWLRAWYMYLCFRMIFQMIAAQALQICSVLSALVIIICQILMIAHDMSSKLLTPYVDAITSGNNSGAKQILDSGATNCAYVVGTGIANWSTVSLENITFFILYHLALILFCIMLLCDELFNIRVGLLAPQWSRAGVGYTLMFLSTSTLATSPNWGYRPTANATYAILCIIFGVGCYNVFRTVVGYAGLLTRRKFAENYRNGRFPLRPWIHEDHPYGIHSFPEERANWRFWSVNINENPHVMKGMFWTERWQRWIGDQVPMLNTKVFEINPHIVPDDYQDEYVNFKRSRQRTMRNALKKRLEAEQNMTDDKRRAKLLELPRVDDDKYWAPLYEYELRRAQAQRICYDLSTIHRAKGLVSRKFWHGGELKLPPLTKLDRARRAAIDPAKYNDIPEGMKTKTYRGLPNWRPNDPEYRAEMFWWDLRRVLAMACALCLAVVHVTILWFDVPAINIASQKEQYSAASTQWRNDRGPSDAYCQYYSGSTVAIFVQYSRGVVGGVTANMWWTVAWHMWMIGMCVTVFLVAHSNCRYWGMHVGFPCITLVGPRLSSNSIGLTLGFVAISTLQLGFFYGNSGMIWITRIVCYCCLVVFVLYLGWNERLRSIIVRHPFKFGGIWLATNAIKTLDNMKYHQEVGDQDDEL